MTAAHNFEEDLQFSLDARYESFWDAIYEKAFVNLKKTVLCEELHYQKMGIDRFVHLTNTRIFAIDEKVRRRDYGDILLEYISNDQLSTPGWICKNLAIDFMAYGFIDTKRAYLFSWPMLRRVWQRFGDDWINLAKAHRQGFKHVEAKNVGYKTLSVAVPYSEIKKRLNQARIIQL